MQQSVNRAKGVVKKRTTLDQQRTAGKATYDAAEKKWSELDYDIQCRLNELNTIDRQAEAAKIQLQKTCQDADLLAELRPLESETADLGKQAWALEEKKRSFEHKVDSKGVPAYNATGQGAIVGWDKVEAIRQEARQAAKPELDCIAELMTTKEQIEQTIAGLDEKTAAIREKMALATILRSTLPRP